MVTLSDPFAWLFAAVVAAALLRSLVRFYQEEELLARHRTRVELAREAAAERAAQAAEAAAADEERPADFEPEAA